MKVNARQSLVTEMFNKGPSQLTQEIEQNKEILEAEDSDDE